MKLVLVKMEAKWTLTIETLMTVASNLDLGNFISQWTIEWGDIYGTSQWLESQWEGQQNL